MSLFLPDLQKFFLQATAEVVYWRCSLIKWIKSSFHKISQYDCENRAILHGDICDAEFCLRVAAAGAQSPFTVRCHGLQVVVALPSQTWQRRELMTRYFRLTVILLGLFALHCVTLASVSADDQFFDSNGVRI